jgi:hypothetical protein
VIRVKWLLSLDRYVGHINSRLMSLGFKTNIARFFAVAVLLSAIACSELPELARLIDNASNDFTTPSCLIGEITTTVVAGLTVTFAGSPIDVSLNSSDVLQTSHDFRGSGDLFLLYSILRT